jgi:hypothetical protein
MGAATMRVDHEMGAGGSVDSWRLVAESGVSCSGTGAGDGDRTRDFNLGKKMAASVFKIRPNALATSLLENLRFILMLPVVWR